MMGRPPKPTALKLIQGNPGKRPINDAEPVLVARIPSPPESITTDAAREWHRLAPILHASGLLTDADRDVLWVYCEAVARYDLALGQLTKHEYTQTTENGYQSPSAWHSILTRCEATIAKLGAEMGLSPASRSRIRVDDGEKQDEFDAFLKSKPKR